MRKRLRGAYRAAGSSLRISGRGNWAPRSLWHKGRSANFFDGASRHHRHQASGICTPHVVCARTAACAGHRVDTGKTMNIDKTVQKSYRAGGMRIIVLHGEARRLDGHCPQPLATSQSSFLLPCFSSRPCGRAKARARESDTTRNFEYHYNLVSI